MKAFETVSMEEGGLLWGKKVVPTTVEFVDIVKPIHFAENGVHCMYVRKLRKALQHSNYIFPNFLCGLDRACLMYDATLWWMKELNAKGTMFDITRVLHDCPECFWKLHTGCQWPHASSVKL